MDVCYPNPCKHDGICKPDPTDENRNGTMCDCLDGYYGPTCDIGKVNYCMLSSTILLQIQQVL